MKHRKRALWGVGAALGVVSRDDYERDHRINGEHVKGEHVSGCHHG